MKIRGYLYAPSALIRLINNELGLMSPAYTLESAVLDVLEEVRPKDNKFPGEEELIKLRRLNKMLNKMKIVSCFDKFHVAYKLSRHFNIPLNKSIYLACALGHDMVLVTFDQVKRELAAMLGILVYPKNVLGEKLGT